MTLADLDSAIKILRENGETLRRSYSMPVGKRGGRDWSGARPQQREYRECRRLERVMLAETLTRKLAGEKG